MLDIVNDPTGGREMRPYKVTTVTNMVEINSVDFVFAELLGYVEGLKFATADKPMPIYNAAIQMQLVNDQLATSLVIDKAGKSTKALICTDETGRAAFEAQLRGMHFTD